MGMILDTSETSLLYESGYNKGFTDGIKGSILKAEYKNRLKADMVAMLTDILFEIEEEAWNQGCQSNECAENEAYTIRNLILEKIDSLKSESEDKEEENDR